MALYPCRHELRPYDPNTDPSITPWMFIAHVAVADRPGIDSGPSFHSGLEWHFYIDKGPGTPQEIITQLRDTRYQADSSYLANGFWQGGKFCGAISFESEGTGEDEWTNAQLDAIIWLFRQANQIDGIPLVVCPAWDARGLGYHRLFNQWNEPYHSCPGDSKVWQFYNIIIPALTQPVPTPEPEVDDLPLHIVIGTQQPEWWLTDWITKRYIGSPAQAAQIIVSTKSLGAKIECTKDNGPVPYDQNTVDSVPTVK